MFGRGATVFGLGCLGHRRLRHVFDARIDRRGGQCGIDFVGFGGCTRGLDKNDSFAFALFPRQVKGDRGVHIAVHLAVESVVTVVTGKTLTNALEDAHLRAAQNS